MFIHKYKLICLEKGKQNDASRWYRRSKSYADWAASSLNELEGAGGGRISRGRQIKTIQIPSRFELFQCNSIAFQWSCKSHTVHKTMKSSGISRGGVSIRQIKFCIGKCPSIWSDCYWPYIKIIKKERTFINRAIKSIVCHQSANNPFWHCIIK